MVQRLLASLACCGLLALAGCSDDSSSSAGPTLSPAAESSSPSPSPTTSPATDERAASVQFVRSWVQLLEDLNASGDPGPLLAASHQCEDCETVADNIESIYDAGGWIRSDGYAVIDPVRIIGETSKRTTLRFKINVGASRYKESADGPVQTSKSSIAPFECVVGSVKGSLKMLDFYRIPG